ncbi:MAG: 4'-phosphopantetheinyl transferase superfamily protein [Bdellovibrionales bacterium]|nr:4'-phosphopantetheinyl transferase superfamily protein [Bdellovibrionales bacterium]
MDIFLYKENNSLDDKIDRWILPAEKRYALLEFKSRKREQEFLLSRAIMRKLLLEKYDKSVSLEFKKSSYGKPFLEGHEDINFNWSHSHGLFAFAVSQSHSVGVDIEYKMANKSYKKIAEKHFSKKEFDYIVSQKSQIDEMREFQRLWSLKEAYFKAADQGFSSENIKIYFDLKNYSIDHLPQRDPSSFFNFTWEKAMVSVCVNNDKESEVSSRIYEVDFEHLNWKSNLLELNLDFKHFSKMN